MQNEWVNAGKMSVISQSSWEHYHLIIARVEKRHTKLYRPQTGGSTVTTSCYCLRYVPRVLKRIPNHTSDRLLNWTVIMEFYQWIVTILQMPWSSQLMDVKGCDMATHWQHTSSSFSYRVLYTTFVVYQGCIFVVIKHGKPMKSWIITSSVPPAFH